MRSEILNQDIIDQMVRSIITQSELDAITKVMGALSAISPPPTHEDEDRIHELLERGDVQAWEHVVSLREHFRAQVAPYFEHVDEATLQLGLSFGAMMWLHEDFYQIRFLLPHRIYPHFLHFLEAHYPMAETSPNFLSLEELERRVRAGQPIGPAAPPQAEAFFT